MKQCTLFILILILMAFFLISEFLFLPNLKNPFFNANKDDATEPYMNFDCCPIVNAGVIRSTVPIRVPLSPRDLSFIGQVDCTNDLDCDYPLKCCGGKCKPPVVRQDNTPDCRSIPMRIKTC